MRATWWRPRCIAAADAPRGLSRECIDEQLLALWQRLARWPLGKWLFSRAVCFKAPYFGTISPLIVSWRVVAAKR